MENNNLKQIVSNDIENLVNSIKSNQKNTTDILQELINTIPKLDFIILAFPELVEVLEQLSRGLSYNIIAQNLFLSPSTIRKHIENIYTKLEVHNKLEAIEKARKNNIL